MAVSTGVNTNSVVGTTAATLTITTEMSMTLYVFSKTGGHDNHRIGLEISPDGVNWIRLENSVLGQGCITVSHVAGRARAVILEAEGASSTVDIHLIGR